MPGRLIMDKRGAESASATVNGKDGKSSLAVDGNSRAPNNVAVTGKRPDGAVLTNGDVGPGAHSRAGPALPHHGLNGIPAVKMEVDKHLTILDLPPEIRDALMEGFEPLGELIRRATQLCFNKLEDTINALAEMTVTPSPGTGLVNGLNSYTAANGATDDSSVSQDKKEKLLEYAMEQRKIFVKLLVLTNWSRNINSMTKLMGVMNWTQKALWSYGDSNVDIGVLKLDLQNFKIPNPDITHAREVLASGSAAWMPPFLNYLPKNPVSPQHTLKELRSLNASLNIRLILHEDLPIYLRDYRIANGRATFTIPGEFELDISIGKDDPSTPLYFVDVRFLFRPAPRIGDGGIRFFLDMKVNEILEKSGLPAACEFLHNWALTQKLLTLFRQGRELQRTSWTRQIRIDQVHRVLSVQYWLDTWRSTKNWIELAMESGKQERSKTSRRGEPMSKIRLRWHRHGTIVPEADLPLLDLNVLSMETTLRNVIAFHISHILRSTRDKLLEKAPIDDSRERVLVANLKVSDSDPTACSLLLQLGPTSPSITLTINAVSGKFLAQPSSDLTQKLLFELNSNLKIPAEEAHEKIAYFLAVEGQYRIDKQAERRGWRAVKARLDESVLKAAFKQDVPRHTFFKPAGWGNSKWALASIVNLGGESWWITDLGNDSISRCYRVGLYEQTRQPVSHESLLKIEQFAARCVAYHESIERLKSRGVENALQFITVGSATAPLDTQVFGVGQQAKVPVIFVRTSQLLQDLTTDGPGFGEVTQICYQRFESDSAKVILEAKGAMLSEKKKRKRSLSEQQELAKVNEALAAIEDDAVQVTGEGHFELRITTPLGSSFADPLVAQLRGLARLRTFVTVINKRGYHIDSLTLSTLSFTYNQSSDSPLSVKLHLPSSSSADQTTTVEFPSTSPHRRVGRILQTILNQSSFAAFIGSLEMTLPVVRAFDAIERLPAYTPFNPAIHAHRPESYKISYTNPPIALQITRRNPRDEPEWQIADAHQFKQNPDGSERRSDFQEALIEHCTQQNGQGWRGKKNHVQADIDGLGLQGALLALDKVIREFSVAPRPGANKEPKGQSSGSDVKQAQNKGASTAKTNAPGEHEVITIMD